MKFLVDRQWYVAVRRKRNRIYRMADFSFRFVSINPRIDSKYLPCKTQFIVSVRCDECAMLTFLSLFALFMLLGWYVAGVYFPCRAQVITIFVIIVAKNERNRVEKKFIERKNEMKEWMNIWSERTKERKKKISQPANDVSNAVSAVNEIKMWVRDWNCSILHIYENMMSTRNSSCRSHWTKMDMKIQL